MARFQTREHAITSYGHSNGRELREMADRGATVAAMQELLRQSIDLEDLPSVLVDKYAVNDRAWHLFLNDILRYVGVL
jgi:hypothetical protein